MGKGLIIRTLNYSTYVLCFAQIVTGASKVRGFVVIIEYKIDNLEWMAIINENTQK
jgi:hypothetical protein